MATFYGKYRGAVVANLDPLKLGRIQVQVPAIHGEETVWAMPCVPLAGRQSGFVISPEVGAHVWVEFEGGDPAYPIWSGCFWGNDEHPAMEEQRTPDAQLALIIPGFSLRVGTEIKGGMTIALTNPLVETEIKIEATVDGLQITRGKATASITDGGVVVEFKERNDITTLAVRQDGVQLAHATNHLKLGKDLVASIQSETTLKTPKLTVTTGGLPALEMDRSVIKMSAGPASLDLTSDQTAIKHAAASVVLTPAAVNVNNGALEVI
ncbi:MAG: phage baseplate assembly protein V [Gemmatimonadales bacterium]|nr:phage baseplate assembly protein V [Gemmatimonadales bacterium]